MTAKRLSDSPRDRVLWELSSRGGKLSRSDLAKRAKLKQAELDKILDALELEGLVTRTLLKAGVSGRLKQLVRLQRK
jgi:DNA-binding MarR family transcriptional regulator